MLTFIDDISERFYQKKVEISRKFVHMGTIDNESTLLQVMAWRQTGDMPLLETKITLSTNAHMSHHTSTH